MKKWILAAGLLAWSLMRASAITWHVATNGNDAAAGTDWLTAKRTIQAAVDAASAGETVLVSNGVYNTGGVVDSDGASNRVLITKPLTVRSLNGPDVTAIAGRRDTFFSNSNALVRCVRINTNAVLAGFTITNGGAAGYSGGVYGFPDAVVSNCVISGNIAWRGGAGGYMKLYRCIVRGNHATDICGGIAVVDAYDTLIQNNTSDNQTGGAQESLLERCILENNRAGGHIGGVVWSTLKNCLVVSNSAGSFGGGTSNEMYNCTIIYNSATQQIGGVQGSILRNSILYFNTGPIQSNYSGCDIQFTCTYPFTNAPGNTALDPRFVVRGGRSWQLAGASPCVDSGSSSFPVDAADLAGQQRVMGAEVDMGAYEYQLAGVSNWYVATNGNNLASGTNWATAKQTIQAGVDEASFGDTVHVSNGVYATGSRLLGPHNTSNRVVIYEGVRVISANGPEVTTIEGAGSNGIAAVRCVYMYSNAFLSGFTVTKGGLYGGYCGGIEAHSTAWASNCIITSNSGNTAGGAMTFLVSTLQTTPLFLTHCTVARNTGRGVSGGRLVSCVITGNYCSYNFEGGESGAGGVSLCVLSNCLIAGNIGSGVSDSIVDNCRIEGNTSRSFGGGVQTAGGMGPFRVRNSIIVNNSNTNQYAAGGGIQVSGEASCVIENCLIAGNYSAYWCGGVYHGSVYNCTIVSNTAAARYGGIEPHILRNSIVYGNTAPTNRDTVIKADGRVTFNCTTTNADDAPGAFGNITNEPQFVHAAGGNYRLAASSPCINRGSNGYVTASSDLDGLPRIYDGTVDMGAYEFQGAASMDTDQDGIPDDWESGRGLNPVVSNAPAANADGDWLTDIEEYFADTHPNDTNSFFPRITLTNPPPGVMVMIVDPTSTGRVYGIRWTTNLLENPQVWTLIPPEKTGTGSAVPFTITNDAFGRMYRSGVRLP